MSSPSRTAGVDGPLARSDLDRIYRDEAPRLTRYFSRHLRGSEDVPDLVQEAFTRLIGSRPDGICKRPAAYLQRIARNLLFDRTRRTDTKLARLHVPIGDHLGLSVAPEQAHAIEAAETMIAYRHAVDTLPPKTRDAFLLHRIEGLSYRLIGARLGISIPTVQYHVAKALVHIDKMLEQG